MLHYDSEIREKKTEELEKDIGVKYMIISFNIMSNIQNQLLSISGCWTFM